MLGHRSPVLVWWLRQRAEFTLPIWVIEGNAANMVSVIQKSCVCGSALGLCMHNCILVMVWYAPKFFGGLCSDRLCKRSSRDQNLDISSLIMHQGTAKLVICSGISKFLWNSLEFEETADDLQYHLLVHIGGQVTTIGQIIMTKGCIAGDGYFTRGQCKCDTTSQQHCSPLQQWWCHYWFFLQHTTQQWLTVLFSRPDDPQNCSFSWRDLNPT